MSEPLTVEQIAEQVADRIELEGTDHSGSIVADGRQWIRDALRAAYTEGRRHAFREAAEQAIEHDICDHGQGIAEWLRWLSARADEESETNTL